MATFTKNLDETTIQYYEKGKTRNLQALLKRHNLPYAKNPRMAYLEACARLGKAAKGKGQHYGRVLQVSRSSAQKTANGYKAQIVIGYPPCQNAGIKFGDRVAVTTTKNKIILEKI